MLALIAAVLIVLGLGELAALLAVLYRYAIPRAPKIFHWLLLLPMLAVCGSSFALAWMALAGPDEVLGATAIVLLLVHFGAQACVFWILDFYAIYHVVRMRRRRR